jgi:hypothetical protein
MGCLALTRTPARCWEFGGQGAIISAHKLSRRKITGLKHRGRWSRRTRCSGDPGFSVLDAQGGGNGSIRTFCDADHRIKKAIEVDLRRIQTTLQAEIRV